MSDNNASVEAAKKVAVAEEQLRKAREGERKAAEDKIREMEEQQKALAKEIEEHKRDLKRAA